MVDVPTVLRGIGISDESLSKIRLGRGVVGKSSFVALVAMLVLGAIALRLSDQTILLVLAFLAVLLFGGYFIGVLWFAHKNPGVALLEGAELVHWRQLDMAAKGIGTIPAAPAIPDPTRPLAALPGETEVEER